MTTIRVKKYILFWKITNIVPRNPPKRKLLEILPNKAVLSTKSASSNKCLFLLRSSPKCTDFNLFTWVTNSFSPPSFLTFSTIKCYPWHIWENIFLVCTYVFKDSLWDALNSISEIMRNRNSSGRKSKELRSRIHNFC